MAIDTAVDLYDCAYADAASLFAGAGEVRSLARGLDWSSSPLGPTAGWSPALRTMARSIFDSPFPICLWSGAQFALIYNDAYRRILGAKHPAALGQPGPVVWAEIWQELQPQFDGVRAGGDPIYFEDAPFVMARLEGGGTETAWFNYSLSALRDEDGSVPAVLNISPETTGRVLLERRLADEQAALVMSEKHLRLVIEGARDHVIFTTDPAGIITTWSAGAEAILGWQADEALGQSGSMIFTEEDRAQGADIRELDGAARDGCANDERWHLRKDGSLVFLNGSVHCLPEDAHGQSRGFIKVARDETKRREAEQALRTSEAAAKTDAQRVQLALSAGAIIGTWVWDLPTDRFTVDEPFARAFGLDPALGREGLSLEQVVATVHPDDQAGLSEAIGEAVARGGAYAHQYRTKRANGEYHWLEANGRVEHAPDGTPLSFPGVLIDVEERRQLAAERDRALTDLRTLNETLEQRVAERTADLMQAEEALRQSHKMEAVGQLTGGLAHDFNNLLTAITGGLELLALRVSRGEYDKLDRYVTMAQTGASRAAALTQRLLAFSRRQTLAPTPIDANRLIAGMKDIIDRTIGPEIDVRVVLNPDLWPVLVDAPQLENALLNLCINARDAMPEGGQLTVETLNKHFDARSAADQDLSEGEYVSLCVTDTGIGMPAEIIQRVFEPFFTTKPIGEGTGLGLSMIYGFVRQSGGQVRIYSELGQGTTLGLYLPRHLGKAAAPGQPEHTGGMDRASRGETILIVEDETPIRDLVVEILTGAGYRVLEAPDGPAGIELLRSDHRIDLLVTDVGLPGGLNGRQVADAGRALRPALKVLFITGYAANAAVGAGHLEEGMEVLTKPFNVAELAQRIRTMITSN